jgi:hypothetical protein
MTVEELIEKLRMMPPTAIVFVQSPLVERDDFYAFIDKPIEAVVYNFGAVSVRLEE